MSFLISFLLLSAVLSISCPVHAGTVTGTQSDWSTTQDITALSKDGDWALWDRAIGAPAYEKNTASDLIGDLEQVGTFNLMTEDWPNQNFSWSDGASPTSTTGTLAGVGSRESIPADAGYQIEITLPSSSGNITVWAGVRYAQNTLSVLDGSSQLCSIEGDEVTNVWGLDRFDMTFSEFSPGEVLTITWIATSPAGSARAIFYGVAIEAGAPTTIAYNPNPANEDIDIPRDNVVLTWTPGVYADTHNVYLGTDFDDVNNADIDSPLLVSPAQDANNYTTGRLEFDQAYFWRIDEVNALPDDTIFKGKVWTFSTEPFSIQIPGEQITAYADSSIPGQEPENTINNSGLDVNDLHSTESTTMWLTEAGVSLPVSIQYEFDKPYKLFQMLLWNYNGESILSMYGFKEVSIEYSVDNDIWKQVEYANEFPQATGTDDYAPGITVEFDGVTAKYVRITAYSNWGIGNLFNQYGLSEVRFMHIPVSARAPNPANEATDVAVDVTLGWRAGRDADEHNVYFSTNQQSVVDGTADIVTVGRNSYGPMSLDLGSTYYWKIDEVNNNDTTPIWQGDIWSFSTTEYLVVDDFESYNDIDVGEEGSNLVYLKWTDGYDNPSTNGSTIGYVEAYQPSMESEIVHNGSQSVPLMYNNVTASFSEVTASTADLAIGTNWAKGGATALVFWFYGDPNNTTTEQMYVKINGTKVIYNGEPRSLTTQLWSPWIIDLTSLGINLNNVTTLTIGFERTGATGGSGTVLIDDIRLYKTPPIALEPVDPGTDNLTHLYTFDDGTANDSVGTAHGTLEGDANISGGSLVLDGDDDWMSMPGDVIALNTYSELSIECRFTSIAGGNTEYTMLAYFGDSIGELGANGFFISCARGDDKSRAAISIGNTSAPYESESGADGPEYDDGLEHHMVSTINATDITLYIDGVLISSTPLDTQNNISGISQNLAYLGKGGYTADPEWAGSIDSFRIYNKALSEAEVLYLFMEN